MAHLPIRHIETPIRRAIGLPSGDPSAGAAGEALRVGAAAGSPWRMWATVFAAVGLAALALLTALMASTTRAGETGVYRKAAERALRGEQFYRPDDPPGFTYPPFMVLPYAPLVFLPDRAARAAWCVMNLALLGAIAWMTYRLARPAALAHVGLANVGLDGKRDDRWRTGLTIAAIALLTARYELPELAYQGHDYYVYLFAMMAITAWASGASVRMGAFAGLAAATKATPLLFLPVFLWQKRWRAAAAMAVAAVLATLLPDLLFPSRDGGLWVSAWYQKFVARVDIGSAPDVAGSWNLWNPLNQSLPGTMYRLFTRVDDLPGTRWDVSLIGLSPAGLRIVTVGAELGVIGLLLFCASPARFRGASRQERAFAALGQGGAVLCGMLLLSPMSSVQHFCFLLAPISYCCVDFLYRRRDPWVGAGLGLLLCNALACGDVIGGHAHRQLQAYGHLTWACLITMAMCGYILSCRAKAARVAGGEAVADDRGAMLIPLAAPAPREGRRRAA